MAQWACFDMFQIELTSFFIFIIMVILISFFFQRDHLLAALFLLELFSLVFLTAFPLLVIIYGCSLNVLIIRFLTIRACEGRLGLRILIIMVRKGGNDLMGSLSVSSV